MPSRAWRFKSSPAHIARLAQLVEHILDVNGVIGSSPIARTITKNRHPAIFSFSVPREGIEPPTPASSGLRSTTELPRHIPILHYRSPTRLCEIIVGSHSLVSTPSKKLRGITDPS